MNLEIMITQCYDIFDYIKFRWNLPNLVFFVVNTISNNKKIELLKKENFKGWILHFVAKKV